MVRVGGHVWMGLVLCFIGLWHLYNHTKIHAMRGRYYKSLPWFPTTISKYLELYIILLGCSIFSFLELFSTGDHQRTLDHGRTILSMNLHRIEHVCIATAFSIYALLAIVLDKTRPRAHNEVVISIAALAFSQELLLFHFHSTDHVGIEGQYHWLLEQVIIICLATTILTLWYPRKFIISYTRSLGVLLQGIWLIIIGFMLKTPELIPKGCFMDKEANGRDVVRCEGDRSLHRAKALVNIMFSWIVIGFAIFAVVFHLMVSKACCESEAKEEDVEGEDGKGKLDREGFLHSKGFVPIDLGD